MGMKVEMDNDNDKHIVKTHKMQTAQMTFTQLLKCITLTSNSNSTSI